MWDRWRGKKNAKFVAICIQSLIGFTVTFQIKTHPNQKPKAKKNSIEMIQTYQLHEFQIEKSKKKSRHVTLAIKLTWHTKTKLQIHDKISLLYHCYKFFFAHHSTFPFRRMLFICFQANKFFWYFFFLLWKMYFFLCLLFRLLYFSHQFNIQQH